MRNRVIVAVGLLLVGGVAVAWRNERYEKCEQRGAQLSGLALLNRRPDALVPENLYSGCDVDRTVAYGGRYYHGTAAQDSVARFYRGVVEQDGWRILAREQAPDDHAAILCASRDIGGAKAYLTLSIATTDSYEVHISDVLDVGYRCIRDRELGN
jgi:hypothetical protein